MTAKALISGKIAKDRKMLASDYLAVAVALIPVLPDGSLTLRPVRQPPV
jgi:hypothetical protein